MRHSEKGYALIVTCLLIPIVFLSLGLMTFTFLKTRHSAEIKTSCRDQYHDYFSQLKSQIHFIEGIAPIATNLYRFQMAMIPLLWVPAVAKMYQTIEKIRTQFDKLQNNLIKTFGTLNKIKAYYVVLQLEKTLMDENKKIKNLLSHKSVTDYKFNSKIQIVKKMNILFPPFERAPDIEEKQAFYFNINNKINPKSWMSILKIDQLENAYSCSATLKSEDQNKLIISYSI